MSGKICGRVIWSGFFQVRYASPRCLQEASNLALEIDVSEKPERRNVIYYTQSDEFSGQSTRSQGKTFSGRNGSERMEKEFNIMERRAVSKTSTSKIHSWN